MQDKLKRLHHILLQLCRSVAVAMPTAVGTVVKCIQNRGSVFADLVQQIDASAGVFAILSDMV